MAAINRVATNTHDAILITGIEKHLQTTTSLSLSGTTYATADLVKLVQGRIDSTQTVTSAKAAWHASVVANIALDKKLAPLIRGIRQYVISIHGDTSSVLADFGFSPPKKAVRTPEQKAAAAAKAKATRAARHTMGKNQKKNIKGAVVTTTPIPAPVTVTAPKQ